MGHGVAEMGEDLIGILATKLPKMGEKEKRKKNYDNQVAEIFREEREIFNRNFGMPKKKKKICGTENWRSQSPFLLDSYFPKYLEYILYSFPIKIKPNLLISLIKSMSWILFCLFISHSRYKRQHALSLFALHLFTKSYIFYIVSHTSDCSFLYYSSALL